MLLQILSMRAAPDVIAALAFGWIAALVIAITIHEFSHALAATLLGDSLPRRQGRLTLSPLAHLDPIGTLMMLFGRFGWGRPVQYNPYALRTSIRTGALLVAIAGPASNLALATALAIPTRLAQAYLDPRDSFGALLVVLLLQLLVQINVGLCFFNLIPIFPLDGFSVLQGLLPPALANQFEQTRQWGPLILLLIVFVGGSVLGVLLNGPVDLVIELLIG